MYFREEGGYNKEGLLRDDNLVTYLGGERGLFSGGCIYEGCINNEILHYIS